MASLPSNSAAEAIAAAVAPGNADGVAQWRGQAGEYRRQAGAIRGTLEELDGLAALVRPAEAALDDPAAWRAAADAAETVLEGSGGAFRNEAKAAAARAQKRRGAVRERYDKLIALWDGFLLAMVKKCIYLLKSDGRGLWIGSSGA